MQIECKYEIPKVPFRSGTLNIVFTGYIDEEDSSDWKPDYIKANITCDPFEFGLVASNTSLKGFYVLKPEGWHKSALTMTYPTLPTVATWNREVGKVAHDDVIEKIVLDAINEHWTKEVQEAITIGARKELLSELQGEQQEVEDRQMELENLISDLREVVYNVPEDEEDEDTEDDKIESMLD